jgi:hypothetical protein
MHDPSLLLTLAGTGLAGIAMMTGAFLKGWDRWLELRRLEAEKAAPNRQHRPSPELAELRSRVRRLEAIASGADR